MGFNPIETEISGDVGNPITTQVVDGITPSQKASVDLTGALKVAPVGSGAVENHLYGDTIVGASGIGALGSDGTNFKCRKVDTSGELQVDILTLPVGDNRIGRVKITDDTDILLINTDGSALTDITDDYARQLGKIQLVDRNGYSLDIEDDAILPTNYSTLLIAGHDLENYSRIPTVSIDDVDGKQRLSIEGKVSVSAPVAPPTATTVTIPADNPLDVSTTHTTNYTIPNGVTFHLTQLTYGGEGDPNEKGSKATVSYVDSGSVEHIIERLYFTGFTGQIFPDTKTARDGTTMVGNGTTTQIRILRERLGGAALEIDIVARGYYE